MMIESRIINRADLRFGTDIAGSIYLPNRQDGVIRKLVPPPVAITGETRDASLFKILFESDPGLTDLRLTGSADLQGFPLDLTGQTTLLEASPGNTKPRSAFPPSGLPIDRLFLRIEQ